METENIQLKFYLFYSHFFSKLKNIYMTQMSPLTWKEVGNGHSHSQITRKKMLNTLNISDSPWTHQRSKVSESTTTTKSTDTDESKESQLRYAYLKQYPGLETPVGKEGETSSQEDYP